MSANSIENVVETNCQYAKQTNLLKLYLYQPVLKCQESFSKRTIDTLWKFYESNIPFVNSSL